MPLKSAQTNKAINREIEHQRLTSLINSMADAVLAVDENIKVVIYNSAALNILDINNLEIGDALSRLFKPINKDYHPVDIKDIIKSTSVPIVNRDLRLSYKDGSLINLYISIAPVHLGYGEQGESGYVVLLRDITREKSLEEERDEFISVVSHELRTPVAITEGNISNAQLIADKYDGPQSIKTALKEAHDHVLFLADMINDLSTLSRAERGVLHIDIESINVHELVKELVTSYTPQTESKNLKINAIIDPKLELLRSSRLYVREILQNFITNALKYTSTGQITIKANSEKDGVLFSVSDTGIGISKADQARVYDQFFRSEDYRTRKANGTGLGLYVTQKLTKLIKAKLSLDSQLNKGSTFSVFIPNLKKEK
jgi:two-component system phosphate regulon sensor histidine kinase PhoR